MIPTPGNDLIIVDYISSDIHLGMSFSEGFHSSPVCWSLLFKHGFICSSEEVSICR